MLLISKYYAIVTPESAEDGEIAEAGEVFLDSECTISETVDYIKGLTPSQHPITNPVHVCFYSEGDTDFVTGETETNSYHYSHNNPTKNLKHWISAIKLAGFTLKD